jgi:uncharacterized protein YjbI with pentapeptide repeats
MPTQQLKAALESASSEARAAYISFVIFALYFAVTVGATTHEELLRGSQVTMPALGVGLPIVGFYVLVPPLFVLFHALLLLQLNVLAERIRRLRAAVPAGGDPNQVIAPPFVLTQFLLGDMPGFLLRPLVYIAMWISLIVLPIGILLFVQVRFLPYHDEWVTWWHRLVIVADLGLVWLLWPQIVKTRLEGSRHASSQAGQKAGLWRDRGRLGTWITSARAGAQSTLRGARVMFGVLEVLLVTTATLLFSWGLATIPETPNAPAPMRQVALQSDEPAKSASTDAAPYENCRPTWTLSAYFAHVSLPSAVRDSPPRTVSCLSYLLFEAPTTPLNMRRNLRVRGVDLVKSQPPAIIIQTLGLDEAWKESGQGLDLRGRDLRYADLSASDLRKADLRGADLWGANLAAADLRYATAGDVSLAEFDSCSAVLRADGLCLNRLSNANLANADLRLARLRNTDLRQANLNYANLAGADLAGAHLDDASLINADLQGAELSNAGLDRADLNLARLAGANLSSANLKQANLREADLTAAHLKDAQLDHANLSQARFDGAYLPGARLTGANLTRAYLSGADLRNARLDGVELGDDGNGLAFFGWVDARNIDPRVFKELLDPVWQKIAPGALPSRANDQRRQMIDDATYERNLAWLLTGKACRAGANPVVLQSLVKRVVDDIMVNRKYRPSHQLIAQRLLLELSLDNSASLALPPGSLNGPAAQHISGCPAISAMPEHMRASVQAILVPSVLLHDLESSP